eukprot:1575844-Rhodomonas_salina.2
MSSSISVNRSSSSLEFGRGNLQHRTWKCSTERKLRPREKQIPCICVCSGYMDCQHRGLHRKSPSNAEEATLVQLADARDRGSVVQPERQALQLLCATSLAPHAA